MWIKVTKTGDVEVDTGDEQFYGVRINRDADGVVIIPFGSPDTSETPEDEETPSDIDLSAKDWYIRITGATPELKNKIAAVKLVRLYWNIPILHAKEIVEAAQNATLANDNKGVFNLKHSPFMDLESANDLARQLKEVGLCYSIFQKLSESIDD